eukprot:609591-Prorocentrum_minimum.AAC.1
MASWEAIKVVATKWRWSSSSSQRVVCVTALPAAMRCRSMKRRCAAPSWQGYTPRATPSRNTRRAAACWPAHHSALSRGL